MLKKYYFFYALIFFFSCIDFLNCGTWLSIIFSFLEGVAIQGLQE